MKRKLILLALSLAGLPLLAALVGALLFRLLNRSNGELVSGGEKRVYLLYVPRSYNPATPAPLVLSLHGFAGWPAHQQEVTRWDELAEQHGFIVAYPCGTRFPLRWRAYADSGQDVGFLTDLIDKLAGEYNIDPARIYVNGISNGGGMTARLACELSGRIAAIGMVSGAFLTAPQDCRPARPVPAILFHGTADPIVPFQGGRSGPFDRPFPAIRDWVAALAQSYGCDEPPLELPASGQVSGLRYTGCKADVDFYIIEGGGHAWPGGKAMPVWISGHTSQEIDATRVMWDFFVAHPLDAKR